MTNNILSFTVLILIINFTFSCENEKAPEIEKALTAERILPIPISLNSNTGFAFVINEQTTIYVSDEEAKAVTNQIATHLRDLTQYALPYAAAPSDNQISLALQENPVSAAASEEGYKLTSSYEGLSIEANSAAGLFYGTQTLIQLLPNTIPVDGVAKDSLLAIGAGEIVDYPLHSYRGSMLDVARHFFDVPTVKKYIDYIARFKMNILHLHLSDDQGWRIEIKSWPKLTEIGGQTEVGGGEGGFYTQEEFKEIVQYAKDRFITIIPEIDMPGHTNAALASYPELNCDGKATELYTGIDVGFSTLCTDKKEVYQFVEDVITEISGLNPHTKYFHVGGDESHVTPKPDYIKFINRVQSIVDKLDLQLIGWDEVTLGELSSNSVAQYWDSEENAKNAANRNLKVIMSPAKKMYLDMKYTEESPLGLSWAGLIEIDDAYNWDPFEMEEVLTKENVLGIEAPLWSETIDSLDDIEYLLFPRITAYAEIAWAPKSKRNWEYYKKRLMIQQEWMDSAGINYYKSPILELVD